MIFFYWLIAIMPLDQHRIWGYNVYGTLTVIKCVGILCFLVALAKIAASGVLPPLFRSRPARWYLAYLLLQCSSYFVHVGNLINVDAYSNIFSILALFITTFALVDTEIRVRRVLLVGVGAVGFSSLYVIRQWQKYGDVYANFRPGGVAGDANEFALITILWIPLCFAWAFSRRPKWEKRLAFGGLCASLLGTTFAASRGGVLGLLAGLLFMVWQSKRRMRYFALFSVLLVPMLLLSGSSIMRRFTTPGYGDKLAEQARRISWTAGMRMIMAHPIAGVGLENFKPLMPLYQDPGPKIVSLAHNTYVEIAAELGIPGLLAFVGLLFSTYRTLGRISRQSEVLGSGFLPQACQGLQAGLVAFMAGAFFMSNWWQKMFWFPVFLAMRLETLYQGKSAWTKATAPTLTMVLSTGARPQRI